jgi:hypothetical protein
MVGFFWIYKVFICLADAIHQIYGIFLTAQNSPGGVKSKGLGAKIMGRKNPGRLNGRDLHPTIKQKFSNRSRISLLN